MNLFDQLPYSYRGFGEGEYIFNFFLPEGHQTIIEPRDILAIYWKLCGFTPDLTSHQIKPSTLRIPGGMKVVEIVTDVLKGHDLTICYSREKIRKEIPADIASAVIDACRDYMNAMADTELNEEEISALICLNERIRQAQHDAVARITRLGQLLLESGETAIFRMGFNFLMREDHPDYHGPCCLLLFHSSGTISVSTQNNFENALEQMCMDNERDWNEKRHLDNSLYQVAHSSIFRDLEDRSAIPLRHLCRIGRLETNIKSEVSSEISLSRDINP